MIDMLNLVQEWIQKLYDLLKRQREGRAAGVVK